MRIMCVKCLVLFAMTICFGLVPAAFAQQQYRTVTDKEVGSIYQQPDAFPYLDFGAFAGSPMGKLDPSALQVLYGRFDQFAPSDPSGFPYAALRAYEAHEVAAGRHPIFVTATYMGKSRPVLFSWSLGLVNGVPTAPQQDRQYAVNVQDNRFIHFWLSQYVRPLFQPSYNGQNPLWLQLDECAFEYSLYGVLDDDNKFVAGVPWDSPFPQNQAEYETGIETFFAQVKSLAPDMPLINNVGSMSDPTNFPAVYANVDGGMTEDVYGWHADFTSYIRNVWYAQNFSYYPWLGSHGRVAILRALIPSGDPNALLTSFVVYSLLKGPNFFFAPGNEGSTDILPSRWQGMEAMLGEPTSALQSLQEPGAPGPGYRLFWRNFNGGTAYLNWTGSTQTVTLNTNVKYYDQSGQQITKLEIPDGTGTYLTAFNQTHPVLQPRITPRTASPVTSPLLVTIEDDTPGTVIHYTLNGSAPGLSSPVYSEPLSLNSSTVVNARAFYGEDPSWTSTASYTVSSKSPTVQFTMGSDTGPVDNKFYPVLSLSALPASTVTVHYSVQNGSPATGSVTFLAGKTYRYVPIVAAGGQNTKTTVTITSISGAVIGSLSTFQYTSSDYPQ
jgi:hypothetical protein